MQAVSFDHQRQVPGAVRRRRSTSGDHLRNFIPSIHVAFEKIAWKHRSQERPMCGRYFRRSDKQRIAEAFDLGVFEDLPL
jgi:hypothetical protein